MSIFKIFWFQNELREVFEFEKLKKEKCLLKDFRNSLCIIMMKLSDK